MTVQFKFLKCCSKSSILILTTSRFLLFSIFQYTPLLVVLTSLSHFWNCLFLCLANFLIVFLYSLLAFLLICIFDSDFLSFRFLIALLYSRLFCRHSRSPNVFLRYIASLRPRVLSALVSRTSTNLALISFTDVLSPFNKSSMFCRAALLSLFINSFSLTLVHLLILLIFGLSGLYDLITLDFFIVTRKYYPSSKQFRDPPTYTHQPSMQQKVPFSLIRCSSSKVAFCSCVCGVRLAHI